MPWWRYKITSSTLLFGRWRKDNISFTFTWGWRCWKHSCILSNLSRVICEHILLPDHKSSEDPSLLCNQTPASLSLPAAILFTRFKRRVSKREHLSGIFVSGTIKWRNRAETGCWLRQCVHSTYADTVPLSLSKSSIKTINYKSEVKLHYYKFGRSRHWHCLRYLGPKFKQKF